MGGSRDTVRERVAGVGTRTRARIDERLGMVAALLVG
jgi:hypothetical protein